MIGKLVSGTGEMSSSQGQMKPSKVILFILKDELISPPLLPLLTPFLCASFNAACLRCPHKKKPAIPQAKSTSRPSTKGLKKSKKTIKKGEKGVVDPTSHSTRESKNDASGWEKAKQAIVHGKYGVRAYCLPSTLHPLELHRPSPTTR